MRKLHPAWGRGEIIDYNLRPGDGTDERGTSYTIFEEAQNHRVSLTRDAITKIMLTDPSHRWSIVEPGCSTGDIGGFYSTVADVWGCDVVPAAVEVARSRWPLATFEGGVAEDFEPRPCDILVLCEFLEHIVDPVGFVKAWMPLAKYAVISHPLVGDGHDPEIGHFWAYDIHDFRGWFSMTGYDLMHEQYFHMGYHMILGTGVKK